MPSSACTILCCLISLSLSAFSHAGCSDGSKGRTEETDAATIPFDGSEDQNDASEDSSHSFDASSHLDSSTLPDPDFVDELSAKDETTWYYRLDPSPATTVAAHVPSVYGMRFVVGAEADGSDYYNAEIYNRGPSGHEEEGSNIYLHARMDVRLRNVNPTVGSRGWGFWNGSMSPGSSRFAWFVRVEADPDLPPPAAQDGFYAAVQDGAEPTLIPVVGLDLTEWHTYSIRWRQDGIGFFIDGEEVHHEQAVVPSGPMRADIWCDNAVYDASFTHILQDPMGDTELEVDRIEIWSDGG